jgi:conjugal transfer/entry exclusion protein
MKYCIIVILSVVSFRLYAAGLPEGITPTVQLSNQSPEDNSNFLSSARDRAQQITSAMETLLTLNQSLQYQIQAAQALSEGSWDGFVEFFNYETAAIAGYNDTIANLDKIAPFVDTESDTYQTLAARSANMKRSMDAANEMVRSTDSLVKQTEANAQLVRTGIRDVSNAPNTLQALQGQAKILSAVASESRASTQLLYTQQRYLQTVRDNDERMRALQRELFKKAMEPPDPYDLNSPYRRPKESDFIKESLTGKYIEGSDSGGFRF